MPAADTEKRTMFRLLVPIEQTAIKLAEGDDRASSWIQVARVGSWIHEWYEKFDITLQDLADMVANFTAGQRDVMVDYNHASFSSDPEEAIAAGWTQELETRADGAELWALVEWTPGAAEKIKNQEYRFISPEFDYLVPSKESGEILGTVLYAIGLCNRPFIEGMAPVELREPTLLVQSACRRLTEPIGSIQEGGPAMDEARIRQVLGLADDVKLTDEHMGAALTKLDEQIAALTAENTKLTTDAEGKVLVDEAEHAELLQLREKPAGITLSEADHTQLKADAAAGKSANEKLLLRERQDMVSDGVRAGKVLPAEVDDLLKLAEGNFAAVQSMIAKRPKLVELSVERGIDDGSVVDAQKVGEFIKLQEAAHKSAGSLSHVAYSLALSDARKEFPKDTYEQWVSANNKAAA